MKAIALGVILLALAGCQNVTPDPQRVGNREPVREERGMTRTDIQTARPPLDLAAPAKTATATFALG
jgi:hypothetical protein